MKTPSDPSQTPDSNHGPGEKERAEAVASLMGLGERSVQKSYYPQLRQKIRELEKSEHRYRLLAENISDVIWMLDMDLSIVYISPSIERISGYQTQDLIGTPFTDLLAPDHARRFAEQMKKQASEPGIAREGPVRLGGMELEQVNRDGSFCWIDVRVSCMTEEGGPHLLGITRDISERKTAQREKEEMQQQLIQAQKMESIGTLAGGIAHDFNNLLTVINGYTDLILKDLEPDSPLEKKLTAVAHAGRRAEELTRQLLAFSRKQIFAPRSLDINETLGAMDQMLRRLIGEDIHVETILENKISPISADQAQIEQIFTNLVINARDALNALADGYVAKKRLTIETGQTQFNAETAARLSLKQAGPYVFFSVSDNGRGMDRETQKRIFEPFFTTKSKYKGTGLGLAMIYGIVKQNQGAIRVYSEPDKGAMFKIYWPVAPEEPHPVHTPRAVYQDLSGSETVLLVEDDPEVLSFAANALMSMGYTIFKARNGKEALDWFQQRIASGNSLPHVVVTDLIMPEMSGREFAEAVLALSPDMRVIFVSGHTDNHIVHNGMLKEGVNFLQKPYSQQRLAKQIRNALDQAGP
jgi:two-component system cell cycle sensor histidine kinase/response regulator CckA